MRQTFRTSFLLSATFMAFACAPASSSNTRCALDDTDCDGVPDALGSSVRDSEGDWSQLDFDGDNQADGYAVDLAPEDGVADGIIIDTDGDGLGDAVDLDGDLVADVLADGTPVGGSGGAAPASGGATSAAGGSISNPGGCALGQGVHELAGTTTNQYGESNVRRSGQGYKFIANGWGDNWRSHSIAYNGTTMTVESFDGSKQPNGAPAGYPTMFCGKYSDKQSNECGLPKALSAISSIGTGLAWSHPSPSGTYNVAYDVWMGNSGNLSSYFMVWFKKPTGENPAGSKTSDFAEVAGVEGVWDIYTGSVNGLPIVNYVRPTGQESASLAFDMMDFIGDAKTRNLNFPGAEVLSVAVGFEIWEGPVSGLSIDDFCVDVQ
jgi:hypothetical protein